MDTLVLLLVGIQARLIEVRWLLLNRMQRLSSWLYTAGPFRLEYLMQKKGAGQMHRRQTIAATG